MATISVVSCACGGLDDLTDGLVRPLIAHGHQVCCTMTPTAWRWAHASGELDDLASLTGFPVRGDARLPSQRSPHPSPDVYVLAPTSANTVAKLALGIADNQALTSVSEALGTLTPVVAFPRVNAAHTRHPAWAGHMEALRRAEVRIIEGKDVWPLYEPRQGDPTRRIPWGAIIDAVEQALHDAS